MDWIRTGAFVVLTLVAATLPVSGDFALKSDAGAASQRAGVPTSTCPVKPAEHGGLSLHATPNADMWANAPVRLQTGGGSHIPAVTLVPPMWSHLRPCLVTGRACRMDTEPLPEQTRAWMACRYPNAPPLGV